MDAKPGCVLLYRNELYFEIPDSGKFLLSLLSQSTKSQRMHPEVPSPSVIFWDVGKDTNWDRPVSKRCIQTNSDSWIWLSDIVSLVKHRKGRPHVAQINIG